MSDGKVIFYVDDGSSITLPGGFGDPDPDSGLFLAKQGVEGWYSTPDLKVSLTERGQGNGAHDVQVSDILYSARTVTVHWVVSQWADRDGIVSCFNRMSRLAGHKVRMRFIDATSDTFVDGYVAVSQTDTEWSADWNGGDGDNTVTVVCPRPERLGWRSYSSQIFPTMTGAEGLYFGPSGSKWPGLVLGRTSPRSEGLRFGDEPKMDSRNRCVLTNSGTFKAYPTFTVTGPFDRGVWLSFGATSLIYRAPVRPGSPVLLDSRNRTASINGVDVSQNLSMRRFPTIPPGGSLPVTLMSAGTGWVMCSTRDTYM